jgi:5-(carboxyamino)imidazole ribonucleotide synthase
LGSETYKSFRPFFLNKSMFNNTQTIGILGGGQLGKMLQQVSLDLDLNVKYLDPDPQAPCASISTRFTQGSYQDYQTVLAFGADCHIISIEIENVNLEALAQLEKEGKKVYPQPHILEIIKDKRLQKQFFVDNNIPTSEFVLIDGQHEIPKHASFLPAFNKLGTGGYDGKGVQKINSLADAPKGFTEPGLLEKAVDFTKELAVIVARNQAGQVISYPTVEMVFHPEANLVEYLLAPAQISEELDQKAQNLAKMVAEKFEIIGLLAVEMFLDKSGNILVNEVAPRTHNSGHHTQKANYTSQFEQQLRAISNLPLGSTKAYSMAAMLNILGEEGYEGPVHYQGMDQVLTIEGVFPFLYGKAITKPFRKMGHVTVIGDTKEAIEQKINKIKASLKVISKS